MHLERADGGDEHRAGGLEPGLAALDVEELLGAEVGAEAGFGDDVVGELERGRVAITELQPCAMLANGPPWTKAGVPSSVCTRLGASASLSSAVMAPCRLEVAGAHRLAVARVADDDVAEALRRSSRSVARQKIAITSDATVMSKPSSRGKPLATPPSRVDDLAQRAVVHVEHAAPGDAALVDAERVAPVDVVVDHRRQQVVRAVMAWKSPVKWRLMSSIGTTCA